MLASGFVFAPSAFAASTEAATSGSYTIAIICISAALAFGVGALAAGMAIGKVGSAAMGAISERP